MSPVRRHGFETLADMARSMGVVVALVALVVLITVRPHGQQVRLADVPGTYAQATIGTPPFPLVRPVGLSDRWQATSVYYDPPERTGVPGVTRWHVGYVTPDTRYAGVEQTNGPAPDALSAVLDAPVRTGTSSIGGVGWQQFTGDSGQRRALLRTVGPVTVVVDGTAGWAELAELAGALRAG